MRQKVKDIIFGLTAQEPPLMAAALIRAYMLPQQHSKRALTKLLERRLTSLLGRLSTDEVHYESWQIIQRLSEIRQKDINPAKSRLYHLLGKTVKASNCTAAVQFLDLAIETASEADDRAQYEKVSRTYCRLFRHVLRAKQYRLAYYMHDHNWWKHPGHCKRISRSSTRLFLKQAPGTNELCSDPFESAESARDLVSIYHREKSKSVELPADPRSQG